MPLSVLCFCAMSGLGQPVAPVPLGQNPWPLERQDRYGSGRAVIGPDPATLTTPWVSNRLAVGWAVSHGPSLGADGMGYFGDWGDNKVFKFDYATGAILGTFQTPHFVTGVPALGQHPEVIVSTDGKVFGVNSNVMDFDWFINTNYTGGSPNLGPEGDVVYGTSNGVVNRLNPFTGGAVWSKSGFGALRSMTVFTRDDSKIVFSTINAVTTLNWADGSPGWSVNPGGTLNKLGVAPNGTIVVGSDEGTVYGLSPADGSTLWFYTTLAEVRGAPAFSADGTMVFVSCYDTRVYALRMVDGSKAWSYSTTGRCEHAPTLGSDGRIYVHNKLGDVYCLSPAGVKIWSAHLNGEARGPMTIGPDGSLFVGYSGPSQGLAIIRQHSIPLDADGLTMERGKIVSGGFANTFASDNQYLALGKSIVANISERPIRAVFTFHTPYSPLESFKLKVEAKASTPGLTRWTEVWNYSTGTWDELGSQAETMSDVSTSLSAPVAGTYTDGNGLLKIRLSWKQTGPVLHLPWTTFVDYIHPDVVPKFT